MHCFSFHYSDIFVFVLNQLYMQDTRKGLSYPLNFRMATYTVIKIMSRSRKLAIKILKRLITAPLTNKFRSTCVYLENSMKTVVKFYSSIDYVPVVHKCAREI